MDEKEVKRLIDQEFKKREARQRFGRQNVNLHTHDGGESPRIRDIDLERNPGVMGRVTFASSGVDYIFQLNMPQTPRQIILNGVFVDDPTLLNIDKRYHVWGTSYLGNAFYLQPVDNRTVEVGGIPYPAPTNLEDGSQATVPVQSSAFFGFIKGSDEATAGTSEGHIADVFGSATLRITVVDFSKNKVVFRVTSMSSGWAFIGNYLIT